MCKNTALKRLSVLAATLLCAALLCACGGKDTNPAVTEKDTVDITTNATAADTTGGPVPESIQADTTVSVTVAPKETETSAETTGNGAPITSEPETTDYFHVSHIDLVKPDAAKDVDLAIAGDGYDIFMVGEGLTWGYRYGCTYLYNEDGSVDAYFASPGADGEWDWFAYRHSDDGGETWSDEKMILTPTQGSMDFYSCCDPGVVYFDGYYYLGYTSTLNSKGACNNLFVARSKTPDGPFEKWNGEGWGGYEPEPIVYYTPDYASWGIGEPSFVELNGTLYIYYTCTCPAGDFTMVATADATDENWPATMEFHGVAVEKPTDSLDIKYVEEWGKFIGIGTGDRMSANSWIGVYESHDGLTFELVDVVRENTYTHLHNAGLSGRPNGHIKLSEDADKLRVIYAYGQAWGVWNTRVQPITMTQSNGNDMEAEKAKDNLSDPMNREPAVPEAERPHILVRAAKDVYEYSLDSKGFNIRAYTFDKYFNKAEIGRFDPELVFSGYDEHVITIENCRATIVGAGETMVTVEYKDLKNTFWVVITEEPVHTGTATDPVELVPVFDTYTLYIGERAVYKPQLRVQMRWGDGSFTEYFVDEPNQEITFTGYDDSVMTVSHTGIVTAMAVGETEVTVTCLGEICKIRVVVSDDERDAYFKTLTSLNIDYTDLDFTRPQNMDSVAVNHACTIKHQDGALFLQVVSNESRPSHTDPSIHITFTKSADFIMADDYRYLEITYMVPEGVSADAARMQIFACVGDVTSADARYQVTRDIIKDGEYHTLRIDMSGYAWWNGTINTLRLDFFDFAADGDTMYITSIKLVNE